MKKTFSEKLQNKINTLLTEQRLNILLNTSEKTNELIINAKLKYVDLSANGRIVFLYFESLKRNVVISYRASGRKFTITLNEVEMLSWRFSGNRISIIPTAGDIHRTIDEEEAIFIRQFISLLGEDITSLVNLYDTINF